MEKCVKCGKDASWYVSLNDENECLDCVTTERDELKQLKKGNEMNKCIKCGGEISLWDGDCTDESECLDCVTKERDELKKEVVRLNEKIQKLCYEYEFPF